MPAPQSFNKILLTTSNQSEKNITLQEISGQLYINDHLVITSENIGLLSDITTIESDVTTLQTDLTTLDTSVSTLQSEVSTLQESSGTSEEETYSVDLDGSNDYIDCGGNADFSFTDGAGNDSAFSISAWVKLDSNNRARVVGKGNMEWLFGTDGDNKFSLFLWGNDSTAAYLGLREQSSLSTGVWHHLVATYDGSNTVSGIKLYRAGNPITLTLDASVGTYAGMASQQGSLRIGQWEGNSSVMNGLVDEVSVFDYELTSSQVASLSSADNTQSADISSLNPLGWWRMGDNNGGTGTTITDKGSGGNDATLTNGPTFSTTIPS